jgi:hypothetical protein
MTPDEFKVFVEELKNLPPMGPTSVQNDVAFWREMDSRQSCAPPDVQLDLLDEA